MIRWSTFYKKRDGIDLLQKIVSGAFCAAKSRVDSEEDYRRLALFVRLQFWGAEHDGLVVVSRNQAREIRQPVAPALIKFEDKRRKIIKEVVIDNYIFIRNEHTIYENWPDRQSECRSIEFVT